MNQKSGRELAGRCCALAAQFCLACVLFLSPLAYRELWLARPVGTVFSGYTDFFIYPYDYFLAGFFVLGTVTMFLKKRAPCAGPWYLTLPLLLIVGLSWLGVVTGIEAPLVAYQALRLTNFFGLYWLLINLNPAPVWIAVPLALGVLRESVVAIAQFQTQSAVGLHAWGELVLNPQADGTSIVRDGTLRVLRAYGLSDHPNLLGGFFAFALILILGYYFVIAHTRARYLLLAPLALGSVALVLTFSRAASLAALTGVLFLGACALWDKQARGARWRVALPAAFVMLLAVMVPIAANSNLVVQRSGAGNVLYENSGEIRSLTEREILNESAARIFARRPLFGVGAGALSVAEYRLDAQFDTRYFYQPAHIGALVVAVELGIGGAVAWLWLTVAPWFAFYARRVQLRENVWVAAVAAAFLALTLIGLFDYYLWLLPQGRIWQWTAFGLVGACLMRRE